MTYEELEKNGYSFCKDQPFNDCSHWLKKGDKFYLFKSEMLECGEEFELKNEMKNPVLIKKTKISLREFEEEAEKLLKQFKK